MFRDKSYKQAIRGEKNIAFTPYGRPKAGLKASLPNKAICASKIEHPSPIETFALNEEVPAQQLTKLNKKLALPITQRSTPSLADVPFVWSESRVALCESLAYFRAHEGCFYTKYGTLLSVFLEEVFNTGTFIAEDYIITSCSSFDAALNIPKPRIRECTIKAVIQSYSTNNPFVVLSTKGNPAFKKSEELKNFFVLSTFQVTKAWVQTVNSEKIFMFEVKRLGPCWYKKHINSSQETLCKCETASVPYGKGCKCTRNYDINNLTEDRPINNIANFHTAPSTLKEWEHYNNECKKIFYDEYTKKHKLALTYHEKNANSNSGIYEKYKRFSWWGLYCNLCGCCSVNSQLNIDKCSNEKCEREISSRFLNTLLPLIKADYLSEYAYKDIDRFYSVFKDTVKYDDMGMGYHSDKDVKSSVVSLSCGAPSTFSFKPLEKYKCRISMGRPEYYLTTGSILYMKGRDLQKFLTHKVKSHGLLRFVYTMRDLEYQ